MKSPYKREIYPVVIFAVAGAVWATGVVVMAHTSDPLFLLLVGIGYLLFVGLGYLLSVFTASLTHRQVDNRTIPSSLVQDQIYWLNGQTEAKYLGIGRGFATYRFQVAGVKEQVTLDYKKVWKYISPSKEAF